MTNVVLLGSIGFWELLAAAAIVLILAGGGHWPEFNRGWLEGRQRFLRSSSSAQHPASTPARWEFVVFVLLLIAGAALLVLGELLL
jgi:hypothetical protein